MKKEVYFQEDSIGVKTDLRVNISPIGIFAQMTFSLSKKTDNYFRNYHKLQSAIANIGELVQGIWWVLSALVRFLTKKGYYNDIGKKCFKTSINENMRLISKHSNFNRFKKGVFDKSANSSLNNNFENYRNNNNKNNFFSNHASSSNLDISNDIASAKNKKIFDNYHNNKNINNNNENFNNYLNNSNDNFNFRNKRSRFSHSEDEVINQAQIERSNLRNIPVKIKNFVRYGQKMEIINEVHEENKTYVNK